MSDHHRRFLVVLRCGDNSFHPSWLAAETGERNWDLHLSYFAGNPQRYDPPLRGESMSFEKGSKYHGLFDYIEAHLDEIKKYELIAFPDDDLQITRGNLSKIFDIVASTGAALAQPSLDSRSYFAHHLALRRKRFFYREVDFVEVMTPIFKVEFLLQVYNYFKLNQSSWGLDFLWSKMAKAAGHKIVIVDDCCFLHTRRVGKGGQYGGRAMEGLYDEMNGTLEKYDIKIWAGQSLVAWTEQGRSKEPLFWTNRQEYLPLFYRLLLKIMKINVISV